MTLVSRIGRLVRERGRSGGLTALLVLAACGGSKSAGPGPIVDAALDLAPASSPDAGAAETVITDGSGCQPPAIITHPAPGCGNNAHPVCSPPGGIDACSVLSVYCGCDGHTTVFGGCSYSSEPYLYPGACPDGGAGDGP